MNYCITYLRHELTCHINHLSPSVWSWHINLNIYINILFHKYWKWMQSIHEKISWKEFLQHYIPKYKVNNVKRTCLRMIVVQLLQITEVNHAQLMPINGDLDFKTNYSQPTTLNYATRQAKQICQFLSIINQLLVTPVGCCWVPMYMQYTLYVCMNLHAYMYVHANSPIVTCST